MGAGTFLVQMKEMDVKASSCVKTLFLLLIGLQDLPAVISALLLHSYLLSETYTDFTF